MSKTKDKISTIFIIWLALITHLNTVTASKQGSGFSLLSNINYQKTVNLANQDIQSLIKTKLPPISTHNYLNKVIQTAQAHWQNRPYALQHAMGEGDWCNFELTKTSCPHIQQNPTYRTDQFNCLTYTQTLLALIDSSSLQQFKSHLTQIAYGANGTRNLSYFNRNHFTSMDFNRVNESSGLFKDETQQISLKNTHFQHTTINHKHWFKKQTSTPQSIIVSVLDTKQGQKMRLKLKQEYPTKAPQTQQVAISYIPTKAFITTTASGYKVNNSLLNKIRTPAVLEVIRDDLKWNIHGVNIKKLIGSGILVSHIGLLFRKHFQHNQLIYHNIECSYSKKKRNCVVKPIYCTNQHGCDKLMFTSATDAFPNSYFYFADTNGRFHCSAKRPNNKTAITTCNRIESLPLSGYLMAKEYGHYNFVQSPSILGIHIEKIRGA